MMDPVISKAESELRILSEDEETLRMIELRNKYESDKKTQINGEKREIAKNLLKKYQSMSVYEVAEVTNLPLEQVQQIEREIRLSKQ